MWPSALAAGASLAAGALVLAYLLRRRQRSEADREAARREQRLFRKILDAVPDRVSVKDAGGNLLWDNGPAPEPPAPLSEPDRYVLEQGEPLAIPEQPVVSPDGQVAWFSTRKLPLHAREEGVRGVLSIHTDITRRKAAEEKLRVYARLLEQSNLELREFASVASHDLQEPLRKIQAFSDRIRLRSGEALGPEGLDILARIQSAASRMQTLIEDLLALSRTSSRELQFERVSLARTVELVLGDLQPRITQSDARIEVGPLPAVEADPAQMRQIFQHLLGNALKFHKPGQRPEITVQGKTLRVVDYQLPGASPGDEVAQIMVTDNGIGFDEKYVEQIFSLFARLHGREEYEGTGMGLAICRKIAQRHGGSIVAKSAKGQGATLILMLPAKQKLRPESASAP